MRKIQKSSRKLVSSSAVRRTRRNTLRSALPETLESRLLMSTYLVNTTADSGAGSLRQAITDLDASHAAGTINFNITPGGLQTISLLSPLPTITAPVTINGLSQGGTSYTGSPLIQLDGTNAGGAGLDFESGSAGSAVSGLAIDWFSGAGVVLNSGGVTLSANYIGIDPSGNIAEPNHDGVDVNSNANALNGNLISGNNYTGVWVSGDSNTLTGNLIGTDVTGENAVPNSVLASNTEAGGVVVDHASNTMIGGLSAADRNVVSGNDQDGIVFSNDSGAGNIVEGNYIGLDTTGKIEVYFSGNNNAWEGNNGDGIDLGTADSLPVSNVQILDNVISANQYSGIYLNTAQDNTIQGNIIGLAEDGTTQVDVLGDPLGNQADGITIDTGATQNLIGGTSTSDRNVIGGNQYNGITMNSGPATVNTIQGNYICTDATGLVADPSTDAIYVAAGVAMVGGTAPGAGNLISGAYGYGVYLGGGNAQVYGNLIGVGANGATALGDGEDGVYIASSGNQVGGVMAGEANVIAFNGPASDAGYVGEAFAGVNVFSGVNNAIEGNSIYGNTLGIDLGNDGVTLNDSHTNHVGPNNFQDFPVLGGLSVSGNTITLTGVLSNAAQGTQYYIDLYNNPSAGPSFNGASYGEGETWVGSDLVTIGASGIFTATFTVSQPPSGAVWSATATDQAGNTSEFSADFTPTPKASSSTTLSSAPSTSSFGQSVTFTATVTGTGSGAPTGTVTFYEGTTVLAANVALNGSDQATFTTSTLGVGSDNITATYSGDVNYNASTGTLTQVVGPAATTNALSVSPMTSQYGQTVTLTATVTPSLVNGVAATGTVYFYDGTTLLGQGTLSNGVATYSTYTLGVGTHALSATYGGDPNFAGSTSNTVNETVNPQASTISGTVYTDLTGNGMSSDDTPLAGVTVDLFQVVSGSNVLVTSTVSASNGTYSFTTGPGNFVVQEVVPTNSSETVGMAGYTLNATSGTVVTGANFENFANMSVNGTVYNDLAGNGNLAGDPGEPGVTVQLLSGSTVVQSTTTASNGSYSFTGVGPGSYTVKELVPAGWTQTYGAAGYSVASVSGQMVSGDNFANYQNVTISGTVSNDLTGNGFSSDDTPLAGWTVDLFKNGGTTPVATAVTAANGSFSFGNLAPGSYSVQEVLQSGWTETGGGSGYSMTALSGNSFPGVNFDNFQNVTLGGTVYKDLTGNGFSADDTPMSGVTVDLFKNGGTTPVATATSAGNGTYAFANLGPGTYSVQEVVPAGYTLTLGASGYQLAAVSGQNVSTDNFDNYLTPVPPPPPPPPATGAINGYVFCDDNLNGIFDATYEDGTASPEAGEAGATVTLTGTTAAGASVSLTTTSGAGGAYSFSGLSAGTYTVSLTGYSPNHEQEQNHGSVVITSSTTVQLAAGQTLSGYAEGQHGAAGTVAGLDFAEIAPGGIQGFVWDDANNDGNIDYNEAGIVNVTITLNGVTYTGAKVSQSTVTDENGEYVFVNLQPGTYTLTESTPSGFTDGKDMVGSLGGSETFSSNCGSTSGCSTGSTNCGSNCGNSSCGQTNCGSNCDNSSCGQTNCGSNCNNSSCGNSCYNDCYGNYGYDCFTNYSTNCYNSNCGGSNNNCGGGSNCGNCGGNSNYCNNQCNCGWNSGCNSAQNTFSGIQIGGCEDVGVGYNFGETGGKLSGCTTDTGSLAFWHNSYGQALICGLNGSSSSKALGTWLATMFPNMYGSGAKINFANMTNAQIAAFYNSNDFNVTGVKLDAAVLSAALSSYVTNSTWAGGSYATKYGFTVSAQGVGYDTVNVGSDGSAFGVANNSNITILQALDATDQLSQGDNGVLYGGNTALRSEAYAIYAAVAQNGLNT